MGLSEKYVSPELLAERFVREQWEVIVSPHVSEKLQLTAHQILDDTIALYAEPHRKYHTLDHIADCLKKLQPYRGRDDHLKLFLALLWHDVIYDTTPQAAGDSSNEAKSADFAESAMNLLDIPGADTVYRLIQATELHVPDAEDEALLCAIDMSILAESSGVYDAYVRGVRAEYGQYSDEQFRIGRLAVLQSFGQSFHHPDFEHLNPIAAENIEKEITLLSVDH